jgi:hypothetical protein
MKLRDIIFLIVICPFASYGQHNWLLEPDYFASFKSRATITEDVSSVIGKRDCFSCISPTTDSKFVEYKFDTTGHAVVRYSFYEGKAIAKQTYVYDKYNLSSYEDRNTLVSTGNGEEMVWDSTILTHSVVYEFDTTYGVLLTNLKWFTGNDLRLQFEINYQYANSGNLIETKVINYPNPSSLGQFELNTSNWIPDPDANRFYVNRQEHEMTKTGSTIKWYKEEVLTGIETITFQEGHNTNSVLVDTLENILWNIKKKYEQPDMLPLEIQTYETGYDGFNDPYDFPFYDRETFHYDDRRNLIMKRYFRGDKLEIEERFEYKK